MSEASSMVEGSGPAWAQGADLAPAAPIWAAARAFPAVWQDTRQLVVGGTSPQAQLQFPDIQPDGPWDHRPAPESDADISQAIAAKLAIGKRIIPLLAKSQLIVIEPDQIDALPDWATSDEAGVYATHARLPFPVVFFDFESELGRPVTWEAPTWPLPFHLRGALCWVQDAMLSIVPFGSVGGKQLQGGTDYQAWSRWVYMQDPDASWPGPGRGDFIARQDGTVLPWVEIEGESFCAHQGSLSHNLSMRVLAAMYLLEAANVELIEQRMTRQLRRQAERKGRRIGLTVEIRSKRSATRSRDSKADYSHQFDVRGHWRHYTDGPIFEAGEPKYCGVCERLCRRVWVPPYIKGPADKPYVPKLRHWGAGRSSDGGDS